MDIQELKSQIEELVYEYVESCKKVDASKLGLDERCGRVYINIEDEIILVETSKVRNLEYYGGFEYIDDDCKSVLGEFTVYHIDDERVRTCFDNFKENE